MDPRNDIREFLVSRRARISPQHAGLPVYGGNRRVKGLRRDEVALLAGISAEYYVRLERGKLGGASEDVLDGIARALQLDEADRNHLLDLARAVNTSPVRRSRRREPQEHVRPTVQRILDSLVGVPAFVENERLDVLAANALGVAFYAHQYPDPVRPVNGARFAFLNRKAKEFLADWETIATDVVGILRSAAGRDPYDKRLTDLSVSSRPAPRSFGSDGRRTRSTCIASAPSVSTTRWSAISRSISSGWSSPAILSSV